MLTADDIRVLAELQRALLEAKPDGTREPRLFVLMEPYREYGIDPEWGCQCLIRDADDAENVIIDDAMEPEEFAAARDKLAKECGINGKLLKIIGRMRHSADIYSILDDSILEEAGVSKRFELVGYSEEMRAAKNLVFFTRAAADEYLEKNICNHPKGTIPYSVCPDEKCWEWHLVGKLLRVLDFTEVMKDAKNAVAGPRVWCRLPRGVANKLIRKGVIDRDSRVADLMAHSREELRGMRGIGQMALHSIETLLSEYATKEKIEKWRDE